MDTGKIKDNYDFYEGFEDEPEIIFKSDDPNMPILHIWDGYLDDILREPNLNGKGWTGLTRDYHQCEGAFDDGSETSITNISEYLNDLELYKNRNFDYGETKSVYDLLCSWLKIAISNKCKKIYIKVD